MKLVIVESPAKAKTIEKYLGKDFSVESSIGHIRDLPRSAAEIPAKVKDETWSRLGVDVDHGFTPIYIVPKEKKAQVKVLKDLLAKADELYLATDGDREGEAIAWHLAEVLKPKVPVHRMVFHEITKGAVEEALANPRSLDQPLIDAQEARRVLDRLYGFELSPVLWKKVRPKLSAGRVQSVATRILVERERERMEFTSAPFWDIVGTFEKAKASSFTGKLLSLNGTRIAQSKDFDKHGKADRDVVVLDKKTATTLTEKLKGQTATVGEVARKPYRRSPMPPFRTSTLQQAASSRLGFSAARTMAAAQRLYEAGHITYMRTDSTALSDDAVSKARQIATATYGKDSVADAPRTYTNKVKNAQEAHEAIRPAGDFLSPDELASKLVGDERNVYDLIWRRTIASQMADAQGETVSITIDAAAEKTMCTFRTSGTVITKPGFKRAYDASDPTAETEQEMPNLSEGDTLTVEGAEALEHETKPPARYSEASLIKRLEELGIGRPSTYASIISTIINRGYVDKEGSALIPTLVAFATIQLLEQHFPKLIDYSFTAEMEDHLDGIARGEQQAEKWLRRFYFGEAKDDGLKDQVEEKTEGIDARAVNAIALGEDASGQPIVARAGRYGPYVQRGEEMASIPAGTAPDALTPEAAQTFFEAATKEHILGDDPETGKPIHLKNGRFGYYVQVGEMEEGSKEKPKRASLLKDMSPETLTLNDALKVLSLPRDVGEDPETKEMITAQNGPYGPYLKRGKDNRSLETEAQMFSVTVDEAVEIFKQPKRRRGAKPPLAELGEDPNSNKPILIKDGRFGPYITDGETNVSLKRGEEPKEIEAEDAVARLAEKRAAGPAPKRKTTAKKTTKKKPAKKKASPKKSSKEKK